MSTNEIVSIAIDVLSNAVIDGVGVAGDDLSDDYVAVLNEIAADEGLEEEFTSVLKVFDDPPEFYVDFIQNGVEKQIYLTATSVVFTVSTYDKRKD